MSEARRIPSLRAMTAAVVMEAHAAVGTRTDAKAHELDDHFPAYDEVLAALQNLVDFCEDVFVKPNENDDLAFARAALAKAEGAVQ